MIRKTTKRKPLFNVQLKSINHRISQAMMSGEKKYFTQSDLRKLFNAYKGICVYCGLSLTSTPHKLDSARFTLYIPLEVGGQPTFDNLIVTCPPCSAKKKPRRPMNNVTIFNYNTFSDQIVQLVAAVQLQDQARIDYFKYQVDFNLAQYINTLFYKPLGSPPSIRPVEGVSAVSDQLVKICEELKEVLRNTEFTKNYEVLKVDVKDLENK